MYMYIYMYTHIHTRQVSADLGSGSARLTTPRGHASMNKDSTYLIYNILYYSILWDSVV